MTGQDSGQVVEAGRVRLRRTEPNGLTVEEHRPTQPLSRGMSVVEAARYFTVSPRTVWRMLALGVLRPVPIPGCRRVVLDRRDLDRAFDDWKDGLGRRARPRRRVVGR